jgi:NTE family protein
MPAPRVAFVLGGGGVRGAVEVGMLQALLERGIHPDLIVGTSIGAINGALLAAEPRLTVVDRLTAAWASPQASAVYGDGFFAQAGRAVRTRTHLNSADPLRELIEDGVGAGATFADLEVPLQVVAAAVERAAERVFAEGPLVPAVLASAAVPGFFPPVEIDGEHYIDGGVVNSIPISPAVEAGARVVYVLQVGRVEQPLAVPRGPVETARIAFEIARRHRFARDLATLPDGVELHVLPSGGGLEGDDALMSYRRMDTVRRRIEQAYAASAEYLEARA